VVQTDHEQQFREQIFLFGIGMFLVCYAVSLYRYQSLMWATLVASIALGITVGAGMLLTSFIRIGPAESEQVASSAPPTAKGRAVDFTLAGDGDDDANHGAQPWQTEMAS
jgi:hypothetical protein